MVEDHGISQGLQAHSWFKYIMESVIDEEGEGGKAWEPSRSKYIGKKGQDLSAGLGKEYQRMGDE